jgi:hypothetical protein
VKRQSKPVNVLQFANVYEHDVLVSIGKNVCSVPNHTPITQFPFRLFQGTFVIVDAKAIQLLEFYILFNVLTIITLLPFCAK